MTAQQPTQNLDGYIRVSRVGGRAGDTFLSPDQQRDAINAWATINGATILEWHTDLDESGAKASRPGLDALLERVESGQTGGMVVAKLDRASRKATDGLTLIKRIADMGGRFVSVNEGVDPATKTGKLILGILLQVAEWEWESRRDGWADVTARANARGVHQGSVVGYTRTNGQPLEVDADAAPVIRAAFEMRAANASWASIADMLDASGLKPQRAANWGINAVRGIIANRAYLGEAKQGEHIKENAHPAIITRDLFAAANAVKGSAHAKSEDWLLSGLCRCQGCRYRLYGNATKRGDKTYRSYRHRGRTACESPAFVKADGIESYVVAEAFKAHDVLVSSTHKQLDLDALNAAVADAEHEAGEFVAKVPASSDYFAQGMAVREQAVKDARQARDNALAVYAPEGVSLTTKLSEEWDTLAIEDKRAALKGLIDYIVVHKDGSVVIVWRGQSKALGSVPTTGSGQKGEAPAIVPFPWPILTADGQQPVKL